MSKASLTALACSVALVLLLAVFILDAYSQFQAYGVYQAPPFLIELIKQAIQVALGTGTYAGIQKVRKVLNEKKANKCPPCPLPPSDAERIAESGRTGEKETTSRLP